jgi:hypothetical protein
LVHFWTNEANKLPVHLYLQKTTKPNLVLWRTV